MLILVNHNLKLLLQYQLTLMTHKDKLQKMLVVFLDQKFYVLLMNQQLLHQHLVWIKKMLKLLLFMILVVVHLISQFLKLIMAYLKLKLLMVIQVAVEKMLMLLFNLGLLMNLNHKVVLILVKIKWLYKELEKLLKKLKLNYHQQLQLKLIFHI